jgi:hypothetical protein
MELSQFTIDILKVAGLVVVLLGAVILTWGGFRNKPSGDREDTTTIIDRHLGSRGGDMGD